MQRTVFSELGSIVNLVAMRSVLFFDMGVIIWVYRSFFSLVARAATLGSSGLLTYFSSGFSHIALSVSSPALSPVLCKSRWHASFHLVFGRPLFLFPGIYALNTFLSMCSPSLLITCPYQINLLSVIFLEACATLVVPRMCSFLILSLRVTPHIHRSAWGALAICINPRWPLWTPDETSVN